MDNGRRTALNIQYRMADRRVKLHAGSRSVEERAGYLRSGRWWRAQETQAQQEIGRFDNALKQR